MIAIRRMLWIRRVLRFCIAAIALAPCALQSTASGEDATRLRVLEMTGKLLIEGYVDPDMGLEMAELLSGQSSSLVSASDDAGFAEAVTELLQDRSSDRHLRLIPPGGSGGVAPGPASGGAPQMPDIEVVGKLLDGNVGYLKISPIIPVGGAEQRLAAAVAKLKDADAIIVDMQNVPGGAEDFVQKLSSYFFDEPTHLVTNQMRGEPDNERWTSSNLASPILAEKPVYVLANGRTASGAESFILGMKGTARATIVGEATYGAGHFGWVVDVSDGYRLWLPRGRTINPRTGKGWEGTGVAPDNQVPPDSALDTAMALIAEKHQGGTSPTHQ